MFEEGDVVRVRDKALRSTIHRDSNHKTVNKHGWLWVIEGVSDTDNNAFKTRSLATGVLLDFWYHYELEKTNV